MNTDAQEPVTVLLADDHPLLMTGFAMSLAAFSLEVIGKATSPEEALRLYFEVDPDVLVLDIRFGEKLTGLDVAKSIILRDSDARIVFLSQFDQDNLIKEAYQVGAFAFVTKDSDPSEIVAAVRHAKQGKIYFLPRVAAQLASLSVRGDLSPKSVLRDRELEIFILMAQGNTNGEISERLNLSTKTISVASQSIKEKLGLHRPSDITRLAVRHRLIEA